MKLRFISVLIILGSCLLACSSKSPSFHSSSHLPDMAKEHTIAGIEDTIPEPVPSARFALATTKFEVKEPLYTVVAYNLPVKEVLFALMKEGRLDMDVHPGLIGRVTINAFEQGLPVILKRLAQQANFVYRIKNNHILIEPDYPVVHSYKIDYVNMSRETKGGISVSNQLASSILGVSGGVRQTTAPTTSTAANQNNSNTLVTSVSNNYFWENLTKNITEILQETDKQVVIDRLESDVRLQHYLNAAKEESAPEMKKSTNVATMNNPAEGVKAGDASGTTADASNSNLPVSFSAHAKSSLESYKTLFESKIIANREAGIITIRTTQKQHEKVREFIDMAQQGAKRQVMIEASIVEVTLNDQFQSGVDWSRLGKNSLLQGFTFQQNLLGTTTLNSPPVMVFGYKNSTNLGDLSASIRLLQTFGNSRVLSSPKMMVLNNQTAVLKVVDNIVYFTVSSDTVVGTAGSATITNLTTTPHSVPIGIWMSVTPQIDEVGNVTLNVRPTIAKQVGMGVQDPNPALKIESRIPQIQVREMESMLQVSSGDIVVLGGLMQDDSNITENGIPHLMNLPILGNAFKVKNEVNKKTELIIFLRPIVIKKASIESQELRYYQQYLPEHIFK